MIVSDLSGPAIATVASSNICSRLKAGGLLIDGLHCSVYIALQQIFRAAGRSGAQLGRIRSDGQLIFGAMSCWTASPNGKHDDYQITHRAA